MDIEQLKQDVREGRIDLERLVDLIGMLQRQLNRANKRIAELESKLGGSPTEKVDQPFSLSAEEQRQAERGKTKRKQNKPFRRGRMTKAGKIDLAVRTERVFPKGVPEEFCTLSHTRPVWRLEDGQAVIVAYEIYRGPNSQYGKIDGVLGRSEFGMEIVLSLAYLVHVTRISFDKACQLLKFFQNVTLKKSQADALLNQLSQAWEGEFHVLCTLLANSAVVHADETSWSIHSVWAFLSEKARLLFFGVHKDAATLEAILDPQTFQGIVVSDDAAVYRNFSQSQKCWAHLLRKAIKLTLLEPSNPDYRQFTDRLLEIYRAACRVQQDQRFHDEGRKRKVAELDDQIVELCGGIWSADLPPLEGPDDDLRLLCNELMRLMLDRQLFVFVTAADITFPDGTTQPVGGTNNEAERTLRGPAEARKTGRTNKTSRGARRQTILVSVLESLRLTVSEFTLPNLIEEIRKWGRTGKSCFTRLLAKMKLKPLSVSPLDVLLPVPDG
jgi:transposase